MILTGGLKKFFFVKNADKIKGERKINEILDNWIMAAILLPALIHIFKAEIGNLFTAWNVYRLRRFDLDGNPATSERVQLLCNATGKWVDATIKYKFSLSAKTRGVYLTYPDGGREKIGLIAWAGMRKRMPPLDCMRRI